MAKGRRKAGPRGERRSGRSGREWVGGCLSPPVFITDRDEPYRPLLIVWMDARDGLIVGQDMVSPEDADSALARVQLAAMEDPLAGPPRRPDRIRVATAPLAAQIRAALGDAIPIDIAPTPELDELLELMRAKMEEDARVSDASYFEDGRVSPEHVARLFATADLLYRLAPWRVALDSQVLRMDIPTLGVEGACVSIIGNLGESLGLVIFPSLEGFEALRPVGRASPG